MTSSMRPVSSFNIPFQRLSELPIDTPDNGMIYGGSKSGKTWLIGTAGDRSLIIDVGNGIETLKSPLFKKKVGADPIIIQLREKYRSGGIPSVAEVFDLVSDAIDHALATIPDKFDVIFIDELTALRRSAMLKALDFNAGLGKSKTKEQIQKWDAFQPARQDYGAEMSLIKQFFAGYIDITAAAGKHFFVLAHERRIYTPVKNSQGKDTDEKELKEIRPSITGQQDIDELPGMFHNVWYCYTVGHLPAPVVYKIRTERDDKIMAGSRHGGLWSPIFPDPLNKSEWSRYPEGPNFLRMMEDVKASRAIVK